MENQKTIEFGADVVHANMEMSENDNFIVTMLRVGNTAKVELYLGKIDSEEKKVIQLAELENLNLLLCFVDQIKWDRRTKVFNFFKIENNKIVKVYL